MRGLRLLLLPLLLALAAPALWAQDRATLVADGLRIVDENVLLAEGHVEVFFKGQRLTASRVTYDRGADQLRIEGPITVDDGKGTVMLADQAELSADLTEGILRSARVVLNQQLQLAASEVVRVGGRYTAMTRVVASSCKICAGDPTPLWELRARRVVHDQAERQIYFDSAQLRLAGVPVFYIPRLRMPDPTLTRATGFLMPSLTTSSNLGTGVRAPYFIKLGDSRDLLVTPYFTSKGARTVDLRYRQAFRTGEITVTGAVSRDNLRPGETRGRLQLDGGFALPREFRLNLHAEAVSDDAYVLDYGYPVQDRLHSEVEITRTRRNEYISGRITTFQTLRFGESNETIPSLVGDLTYHRRFTLGTFGGEGGLRFQSHSHYRRSDNPLDSDGDGIADGRDMGRISLRADWRRDWTLDNGMVAAILGEVSADAYRIGQDTAFQNSYSRLHGAFGAELRWPWVKAGKGGVNHVIEPVVQLVWSPEEPDVLPNEDSVLVEFDQGNLFSLNRFPGSDAVERGARANLGLSYLRDDPAGWTLGLTLGRVVRLEDLGQFTKASGLDGIHSDWLVAGQLQFGSQMNLASRLLLGDDFGLTKGEMRLTLDGARYDLAAGYVYVVADVAENRPSDTSELVFDGSYALTDAWTAKLSNRYDLEADRASRAGLGLTFRNECLAVDLSLSRRFTSSTSVNPTTSFGLSVELLGFGGGTAAGPARMCRR